TTVTNTGPSIATGDLGVSPGSAVTGFPPGTVLGGIHTADSTASLAQDALTTAYNAAASATPSADVAGDLGGLTLSAGVYNASSSIGITGTLTLDGTADDVFVFQIGSVLATATSSSVVLLGGVQACNVFWQVGSSAVLGVDSSFSGTVMALTSVTVATGAIVSGRVLARNGAVTLDDNTITRPASCERAGGGTDEPATPVEDDSDSLAATGVNPMIPAFGALLLVVFGMVAMVRERRRLAR
ncbi:MAG TPA: ice-binding family protein, partial [Terrimesophilobacter sp.]|uniref:ice-binding family protein n=1 Tax=Terrimesophilobacter sp. TaxID=2906435 RepID=UPI002F9288B9